jgi:Flp pilus assembly protein TadD
MKKAKTKKLKPQDFASENVFRYVFMPVLLLLVMSHLLSTYWSTPFLWGIHHLYFFPRWVGWVLIIVTISFFVPPVNSFLLKFFESIFSVLWKNFARILDLEIKIKKYQLFVMTGVISIPLFWALRTKLFLLGDGYFKLAAASNGVIAPTEPLDGIIHNQFYRLLTLISPGIDPSFSYTILSVACGGMFVFLILCLSDLLGGTPFKKVLIFSSLLTLGSIELFFGYVESYTILLVGLTLFILFSILYIQGRANIILSFLVLGFSIGVHVSAIVFIPALLYVIFWKWNKEKWRSIDIFTLLSLLGCLAIIFLAISKVFLMEGEGNRFGQFLSVLPSAKTGFTMFCGAHLWEFINQLLLISPVGTLLFLFFLFYVLKFKSIQDPILNFLLISSLSGLLLVFIYNARLGNADWDLRSFAGIFFTLFGMLTFVKWGSRWSRFKNYGLILIAVGFFHTIPWIMVNANRQMSVDRYIMTTAKDRHVLFTKGGGMWRMARVLWMAGLTKERDEILKEGIKRNPFELGCYSLLAQSLNHQRKYDEAIFYLEEALKVRPDSKEIRLNLGQTYLNNDELEKAIFHMEKIKGEYECDSAFVISLATAYMRVKRLKDAENILQECLSKNQESATIRGLLGTVFFMQRDDSNAKKEWEIALKLNPGEPRAQEGIEKIRKSEESGKTSGE